MWLENLKVPEGRIVKFGRIADEHNGSRNVFDKHFVLKVKLSGGKTECKTFAEVVPAVFKQVLKSTDKAKLKVWPSPPTPATTTRQAVPKVKTYPIQRRRERRAAEMEQYRGDDGYKDDFQTAIVRNDDNMPKEVT